MLSAILIGLHVLFSFGLLMFILLHRGQGGGLSDMFGGGSMSGLQGSALVERNLDRMTIVSALGWTATTILLALFVF